MKPTENIISVNSGTETGMAKNFSNLVQSPCTRTGRNILLTSRF
nr:MAG TPA: hypothetical protein [Caudoviricetes sp.]DAQ58122.1 MAG TPA: hypothetical protein [Caudoviricetes sp.]